MTDTSAPPVASTIGGPYSGELPSPASVARVTHERLPGCSVHTCMLVPVAGQAKTIVPSGRTMPPPPPSDVALTENRASSGWGLPTVPPPASAGEIEPTTTRATTVDVNGAKRWRTRRGARRAKERLEDPLDGLTVIDRMVTSILGTTCPVVQWWPARRRRTAARRTLSKSSPQPGAGRGAGL